MITLQISEELAARLERLARIEGTTSEDVLEKAVESYSLKRPEDRTIAEQQAAIKANAGIFDDEVGDLSDHVDEIVQEYLRAKWQL